MGRARSRGRSGDHLDVMVIDARAVPVAAREGHCRRDSVGVCPVSVCLSVGVAGLFPPRKARAVGHGGDYSTDRWGIALPALVYGWQRNLTYWQEWIAVVAQPSLEDRAPRLQSDVTDRVFSPDNPRNQALQAVLWRLGAETQARSLTAAVGLMMVFAMFVSSRRMQSQPNLINASAWLVWLLVIAPVSHFHYHMLVLWPMTVLAFLALVNTDSLLRTLARVTLVVYLLASICTLALPHLQYV